MLQQGKGADMGPPSEQALPLRCLVQVVLVTSDSHDGAAGNVILHHQSGAGYINSNKTNKGSEWENLSAPAKPNKLSQLLRLSRPAISRTKSSIRAEVVELVDTLP